MIFKRKAYDLLLEWKEKYADHYSILLEGPRRVGKSTIAESFLPDHHNCHDRKCLCHLPTNGTAA